MQAKTLIEHTDNNPAEIWAIISNHKYPETWIPFLDSRRLINESRQIGVYFTTGITKKLGEARVKHEVLISDSKKTLFKS